MAQNLRAEFAVGAAYGGKGAGRTEGEGASRAISVHIVKELADSRLGVD